MQNRFAVILVSFLAFPGFIAPERLSSKHLIQNFTDGKYQVCSQKPAVFADGSMIEGGICFWFSKRGSRIVGIYAIPSTDTTICIDGSLHNNVITGIALENVSAHLGEGLSIEEQANITDTAMFYWDEEKFLRLGEYFIINVTYESEAGAYGGQILYRKAVLNLNGFYKYAKYEAEGSHKDEVVSNYCHF